MTKKIDCLIQGIGASGTPPSSGYQYLSIPELFIFKEYVKMGNL